VTLPNRQEEIMSSKQIDRRAFLKGAAVTAAAAAISTRMAATSQAAQSNASGVSDNGSERPSEKIIARPGSDFMVDVIKATGIEYIASNPGSSFRSLQESIVNYGGNKKPEFLTCMHEESSVAMAHGYAKAAGKPMAILAHGTVGLQHAAMAVYNAWCDRVPLMISPATFSMPTNAGPASSGITVCKTQRRCCAISPSGTINRRRCNISPSP
jgi:hypothetical protein